MGEAIGEPRAELSRYAPRITSIQIDTDKIGMVIGKGGETIRALSEEYEAQIDVSDDGTILVYAQTGEQGDGLIERIRRMTKEVEVGDEYTGKVVKTTTFGAFVELAKGTDGLLHISNIAPGTRPETVEDVLNRGDEVTVRVVEVDKERAASACAWPPARSPARQRRSSSVGTGNGGGPRRDGERSGGGRPRGGRGRPPARGV